MNGLYIHVPFCARKCPYCDFYSCAYRPDTAKRYTDAVCRNLEALHGTAYDTVYFGGGTPSLLPAEQITRIADTLRMHCTVAENAEITLEANPLTVTAERLSAWKKAGISRLSLGVQSFQAEVLHTLGRKHTPQQAKDAVCRAADAGFRNLSLDLMLGLQCQDADTLAADIAEAVSLPATHISAYLLKIEEHTPFGASPPALLSDDAEAERWMQLHDALTAKGFVHYEISNFALPGFESRHNCKYWRCEPYDAIGPAAHGCTGSVRYAVPSDLEAFCDAPLQQTEITEPHACTEEERIMLGLRLSEGIAADSALLRRAKPMMPVYLTEENGRLRMTPQGWLVSNSVLAALL